MRTARRRLITGVLWIVLLAYSIWSSVTESLAHAVIAAIAFVLALYNLWPTMTARRKASAPK
jgi:hypothetical protein